MESIVQMLVILLTVGSVVPFHDHLFEPPSAEGFKCADVDECESPSLNKCPYRSTCYNKNGGYDCECDIGYMMVSKNCVREDSCDATDNGGCGNMHCVDTPQGPACTCSNLDILNTTTAMGKHIKMSSQFACEIPYCYFGSNAVDGFVSHVAYINLASTLHEMSPFMQIDLEANYCIKAVKYYNGLNRETNTANILVNVAELEESAGNEPASHVQCYYYEGTTFDEKLFICATTMFGRYVRITTIEADRSMSAREIEVHTYQ